MTGKEHIFKTAQGELTRRWAWSVRIWKTALVRCGIFRRGFHHARDTAAANMLRSGIPVHIVSGILRRSDWSITWRAYCHFVASDW